MKLKEEYIKLCKDYDALTQYSETGNGKYGKIFDFQNTNYRLILSFIKNYNTFKEGADGIDRAIWELKSHGQEALKQHTNNMLKSRFFSKNQRTYYKTRKGETLDHIPNSFSDNEKWIILYLLLIDGYFDNTPNYILKRSEEIYEYFLIYENDINQIDNMIFEFIIDSKKQSIEELFKNDYIYFDTFFKTYKEYDFLNIYVNSNEEDKEELYNHIINNYEDYKKLLSDSKSKDEEISSIAKTRIINYKFECCLSKKYQPSGVYNKNMIVDNAKLLYLSNYINKKRFKDFVDFIHQVVGEYSKIENIDKRKIYQFIFNDFKDIFEMCYMNIFNPNYFDEISISEDYTEEQEQEILSKNEEKSIIEDIEEITKVSSILKRKALERANYKCELEEFWNCESHYFTNKKNGKNYVELHHLIPREFNNDFEKSIEQIDNYVSLCPRCHRFIHYAVDRERRMAIKYLYNKRIGSLKLKGLEISEEQLKSYYKIEE